MVMRSETRKDIIIKETLRGFDMTFHSTWGLFSPEKIDEGTQLLLDTVQCSPTADILDLGCGYGPIGLTLAKLAPRGTTHLIDKDFVAIGYTKMNAEKNGITNIECYLSNGFSHVPDISFDIIASNFPAKVNKELFFILLDDALTHLKPGGQFYVVTIAGLKDFIKRQLKEKFGSYQRLAQSKTYTVARASKE